MCFKKGRSLRSIVENGSGFENGISKIGAQSSFSDDVYGSPEELLKLPFESNQCEEPLRGPEIHEDIHVRLRTFFATRRRAKCSEACDFVSLAKCRQSFPIKLNHTPIFHALKKTVNAT